MARLQRLIREKDLPAYTGYHRTRIAELIAAGEFPEPIPLSDTGRGKAWLEEDVAAWQSSKQDHGHGRAYDGP
jgi:predicted DNA-binding transcriptional regulator AlpA